MADREEVLKGLEHHRHLEASRNELGHDECFDCPYRPYGEDTCASLDRMIDDALELLKEHEAQIERLEHDLAVTQNNLNYYVNGND